jgi:hypothetical protein
MAITHKFINEEIARIKGSESIPKHEKASRIQTWELMRQNVAPAEEQNTIISNDGITSPKEKIKNDIERWGRGELGASGPHGAKSAEDEDIKSSIESWAKSKNKQL